MKLSSVFMETFTVQTSQLSFSFYPTKYKLKETGLGYGTVSLTQESKDSSLSLTTSVLTACTVPCVMRIARVVHYEKLQVHWI